MNIKDFILILLIGLLVWCVIYFNSENKAQATTTSTTTKLVVQSYNNDKWFLVRHCKDQTTHVYNKTGLEISTIKVPNNYYEFEVDRWINTVTIRLPAFKSTYKVSNKINYLIPHY